MKAPFEPTSCACKLDRSNCKRQPGHLLPGQLVEIAEHLQVSMEKVRQYFWNSPGMLVLRNGIPLRIRTITPRFKKKRCVFLRKNGDCAIYPVAPYGCRYFDVHMDMEEGQLRAQWGAREITEHLEEYAAQRDELPEARHYRPNTAI